MQCLYGIWGSAPRKSGQNPKAEPMAPKSDQKHEKIFYRSLIQKQNKITSSLKFVIMEERKLRRFSP